MPFALDKIDAIAKRMLFAVQEYSVFCWEIGRASCRERV